MHTQSKLPLILDMDGVWVSSDLSLELLLQYCKSNPLRGPFKALGWAWQGKAVLKHELESAVGTQIDIENLPVNQDLRESAIYKEAGERALVSGSNGRVVEKVAGCNPDFAWSAGSDKSRNLTGHEKAALLKERFPEGFAYVGDSTDDVPVWEAAGRAYAVRPSPKAVRQAIAKNIDLEILETRPPQWQEVVRGMRLHQWSKNGLVFMMLALNLQFIELSWIVALVATFVAFGLVASATYLFNDILDLQSDRKHPLKRFRPLASGRLELKVAIKSLLLLMSAGFAIALAVGPPLVTMLAGYVAISLAYSLKLKTIAILDTMVLSLLFCWRVIAGAVVIDVELVPWFTASLALFFLSLALGKRGVELQTRMAMSKRQTDPGYKTDAQISGRGYRLVDYPIVMGLGIASGLGSAVVTMIYALLSGVSIIANPIAAFSVCGLLAYWLGYVWVTINRGDMHHDPIIFALKDRMSLIVLAAMGVLIVLGQVL